VAALRPKNRKQEAFPGDPLREIQSLAGAAGAEVVGGMVQRLDPPNARTAFGKGKVEELRALCAASGAHLVVVDFDLSPSQGRNLEKDLGIRVVDRTEVILHIFARRARTRQAMLQVEMAQAEYSRSRLQRMWTHLERTEGAIGTRGPGETQLETDRRLIDRKIRDLRRKLKEIGRRRQRQVDSRRENITVSLVGYTNAGKSSLLSRLTGAEVVVADQVFATLDTRVRRWRLADGREVLLSDTVGFVRDLPHHLVASFQATLEETLRADLLLHVCDASDPDLAGHLESVKNVLAKLGASEIPLFLILNKIDRVSAPLRARLEERFPESLLLSARTGEGMDLLDEGLRAQLDRWSLDLELEVPAGEGRLIAEVRRRGCVEAEEFRGNLWKGRVRLIPRAWRSLESEWVRAGGSFRPSGKGPG